MTLSAAFKIDDFPFVISDILLTFVDIAEREREGFFLPTSGSTSNIKVPRRQVAELVQKTIIISNRLVVAFAGDPYMAFRIVRALYRLKDAGPITWAKLTKFKADKLPWFNGTAPLFEGTPIVGYFQDIVDGENIFRTINFGGNYFNGKYLGEIAVAGGGYKLLQRICENDVVNAEGFPAVPSHLRNLYKVVALCGYLLAAEGDSENNPLQHAFGGAYEITYFDGEAFKKADVTFADLDVDAQNVFLTSPWLIVKTHYVGRMLILHTARFVRTSPTEGMWEPDLYTIGQVYPPHGLPQTRIDPLDIGFESLITQLHVRLIFDKKILSVCFSEPHPSRMKVSQCGDMFDFVYDKGFRENIENSLRLHVAEVMND